MKYFIKTFGCQMNEADSEKIAGYYKNRGFLPAGKLEDASEVVINTCSVRQSAEDRILGLVNNLIKKRKVKKRTKIIVTGCMLRYPLKYLKETIPGVDEFKRISDFTKNSQPALNLKSRPASNMIRNSKIHAWVTIMEGCNNFCTYCVVPYARGPEKSRLSEEIICEVRELVKRGCKEITLLGQNVNSYGKEFKTKNGSKSPFAQLLGDLSKIAGLEKIKFMTSNPWDFKDEIIEALKSPKMDRYLHLPVQSGDDEILKRMNRKYTSHDYLTLVEKIRRKVPGIQLGTDIIVGFPGETEGQFQNTIALCERVGFCQAYISMYSPRPQTAAYKLKDDVPFAEKKNRWRILENLINRTSRFGQKQPAN